MRLGGFALALALALGAAACGRIDFDADVGDAGGGSLRFFLWAAGDPYYPPGMVDFRLGEIRGGETFDVGVYAAGGFTVVVEPDPGLGAVDRVVFTAGGMTASENEAPYSLGGEDGTNLNRADNIYVGPNLLAAEARDAGGATLAMAEVAFTLTVPLSGGGAIMSAVIIDNITGDAGDPLVDGGMYVTNDFPSEADIEIITAPGVVGRVEIQGESDGWPGQREDWPPYHVAGDEGFVTITASTTYRLVATPYSTGGAGGVAGPPLDITFDVQP